MYLVCDKKTFESPKISIVLFKNQYVWNDECIDSRHVLDQVGVRFLGGTVSGILRTKNLCYILNWVRNQNKC